MSDVGTCNLFGVSCSSRYLFGGNDEAAVCVARQVSDKVVGRDPHRAQGWSSQLSHRQRQVTASIGTDGRVLSRYELITNARTFQMEGENPFGSPWTFEGYSMTMIQPLNSVTGRPGAARHIAVSFRDGFAQCSVRSTWATEEGAETSVTASPYDGARTETRSISTAADRCVVQSGSMFGAR